MTHRMIADRYRLVEELGHGAMGHIWKAFDENLQRHVALKVMSSSIVASPTSKTRFEREARAIAQLQSPHVVQVFDAGIDEAQPYIVMELLDGEDLQTRLERVGTISMSSTTKMVDEITRALTAAHARNIVHRDLKPANVFVTKVDSSRECHKILDFGVVALLADVNTEKPRVTMDGAMVGTPLYMSPEQIRSSRFDHRADLWSLGVLLYRAITGVLPFQGATFGMMIVMICMDPFDPPSSIVPSLPAGVDDFFEKALAKDPDKRFQTAAEFASAWNALVSRAEQQAAKILVVDDEPRIEELFNMRFRRQVRKGIYQFVFASDGEQALRALREQPDIDVIFTDINMPKMDGLTFLSHLGEANPFARAVVVSAYGDIKNIRTAMNRGAFDFLTKPIDFDDLEVTATKTLRLTAELRKSARHTEVYGELRKFVSPSLLHRVEKNDTSGLTDRTEGTVVVIGISGQDAPMSGSSADRLRVLNANFEIIVPIIARYGGVIHKFIGGAAKIVFRGDAHLFRALDACLDVRDNLHAMTLRAGATSPFATGVSIGIASGELLIGKIGSNAYERLDLAVLGEAPITAMLLHIAAKKNQLLVDSNLRQPLDGSFELLPMERGSLPLGIGAFEVIERSRERIALQAAAEAPTVNLAPADVFAADINESGVRRQSSDEIEPASANSSG